MTCTSATFSDFCAKNLAQNKAKQYTVQYGGSCVMKLKRETYLEQIRPYYESDIIKVITGVRRAGKSILLDTIKDELKENGIDSEHIIYINFEDLDFDYTNPAYYSDLSHMSSEGMNAFTEQVIKLLKSVK